MNELGWQNRYSTSGSKQREVDIVTIDSLLVSGNFSTLDLVKLDIPGFELEALRGASSLFGNTELFIRGLSLFSFDGVPGMPILREISVKAVILILENLTTDKRE